MDNDDLRISTTSNKEEGGHDVSDSDENLRFFTGTGQGQKKLSDLDNNADGGGDVNLDALSLSKAESEDLTEGTCLTLRVLQAVCSCGKKKGLWEPSQGNVFKSHRVEETKYPIVLKILEFWNLLDIIFVITCLLSVFFFFLAVGFIMKSRVFWGIIHINNALYTFGLFAIWLRVLITSKYAKTNQGYTKTDVVMALVTVFPIDLILLVIYSLNKKEVDTSMDSLIISCSRLNYLFRIYYVSKYFSKWENQLIISDFVMFIIRTTLYSMSLIHILGCIWHRVACRSFSKKHFLMTQDEATRDACGTNTWIEVLLREKRSPLLDHPNQNVFLTHYWVSVYWATTVAFGLGLGDIKVYLTSQGEILVTALTQIMAWIFTLAVVNGTLTSLLVEGDTERESYLTRRFAIKNYLNFSTVGKHIMEDVANFYDYLWRRRKGIMQLELIDEMPRTMRAEVFYDVNKFVFDQLPLFHAMDQAFMMNLAVHVEHTFHLSGEILYKKNDTGDRMRYVLKGHLEILCADESRVIANIRSGSAIGEIHLIHPYPQVATVRCGSDCDILVLRKSSFKQLMNSYPEHWATFRERMQKRFDNSELLLSLCDKQNQYPRAFAKVDVKLRPYGHDPITGQPKRSGSSDSDRGPVENVTQLFPEGDQPGVRDFRNVDDLDGMSLDNDAIQRIDDLRKLDKIRSAKPDRRQKNLEEEAFKALEMDVMRAGSLAKDLEIPRPPLFITAPVTSFPTKSISSDASSSPFARCLNAMTRSTSILISFRIFTSIIALITIWYYLYAIAFRSYGTIVATAAFHITDILFAVNFWLEISEIVVTPQKTLENRKEILLYRLKEPSNYFEFFAFLPWEYLMTPLCARSMFNFKQPKLEFLHTCFKLNRCFEGIVVYKVIAELEAMQLISVMKMFMFKFLMATTFSIHVFAVIFRLVMESVYGWAKAEEYKYEVPLYWAAQITTATGFGDMLYTVDLEVVVLTLGCIGGTVVVIYFGAKNAALLANYARRRVTFKQTYYCVKTFMRQRKFPKPLAQRVLEYYNLQWRAHEGTLIPTDRSVIWDAPESILQDVTMEQAQTFFRRVPLVQHSGVQTQQKFARALKQYFVPPGETLLYPFDKRRELFFLVRGFCKVLNKEGQTLGTFGEGNYFGLPGLLFGVNKEFEIISETYCLFFCLLFDDYVHLARTNHCILRDYKVFRGEASFRTLRHQVASGSGQLNPGGEMPEFYVKLLKDRNEGENRKETEGNVVQVKMAKQDLETETAVNTLEHKITTAKNVVESKMAENIVEFKMARNVVNSDEALGCWRHLKCIKYLMFLPVFIPTGKFIRGWTSFRTTVAVFTTIFVTAQASFAFHPGWTLLLIFIVDCIAWTDMYIMLHVGFYGPEGQLITDPVMVAKHYIQGSFLLDWVAAFPLDYMLLPFVMPRINFFGPLSAKAYAGNAWVQRIAFCRLPRTISIYRLFMMGSVIETFIFKSLTFFTLLDVVPLMFLFMHVTTCIMAVVTCRWSTEVNPLCTDTSLFLNFKPLNRYHFGNASNVGKLTAPKNFDVFDPWTLYITGLYWTMQTALSVGFGDFMVFDDRNMTYFPTSTQLFAVAVIILGTGISVYLGAKLTACMVGEDSRRIAIREQMKVLFDFLGQYAVKKQIQRRVREVYFNAWDKTKGISPFELFVSLHPTLKADVAKQLYEVHLRKSPLLKNVDEAGIRMLASKLREVFYPEGEFVMKMGDLNDDVFLISTGTVICYGIGGKVLSYLAAGSLFGEISALFEIQRLFSAVAATDADVFVFKREHFLEFLNMYPTLRRALENACLLHYKDTVEAAAQASGIEIILPVVDAVDFEADEVILGTDTTATVEPTADDARSVHEKSTSKETNNAITFSKDPLHVTIKTKTETKEEKIEIEEQIYEDRTSKWWSFMLTFGRIPRDEMGLIHVHQEKSKCNILDFVINPLCPLCSKASFACICLLFTSFSCSLAAYDLAFRIDSSQADSKMQHDDAILVGIRIFIEIFFLLRFIGNFHLAFFDDEGILIIKIRAIIRKYALRPDGLGLDLLTLPYWLIFMFAYPPIVPIFKGIQLFRTFLFWRYINETETELRMQASMIKIVKISIVLCFIFHFCACFWYMIACTGTVCVPDSWMSRAIERIRLDLNLKPTDPPPEVPLASRYCMSVFYVTTAITFTGLNYIEPARVVEIAVTIIFIFTTVFVIGFLIGEITQALASQVAGKIHYEHQLSVIQEHFTSLGLRRSKLKEVGSYYKLLWQRYNGIPLSQIFAEIPYPLQADIAYAIYGSNIKNSRILGKVDDIIIRQLCAYIRHEVYLPGCRIVRSGDVCDAMYFIKRGEIVILDENQNLELCVEILYENECFGEVKLLLPKEQYRFSYVARLESEVGILRREDLDDVMSNYPILQGDLMDRARKIKSHRSTLREGESREKKMELGIDNYYNEGGSEHEGFGNPDETPVAKEFAKVSNPGPSPPPSFAVPKRK